MCEVEGCGKPINRDGVCLRHKLLTVKPATAGLKREREGRDVSGGMGTRKYVEDMFASRRAAGLPDPEPENRHAARYAPKKGVFR